MPNPEEYRRTRRIVDLVLRIANQPRRWTRRRLADHYEISEKQMDKDLQVVRHGLRMPLCHCADGYYFDRLCTLPTLTLSLPEALSLLLAARLGERTPGIPRSDLAAAIARVEMLLPSELLPLAAALERRDGLDDSIEAKGVPLLELQLAIAERAQLSILYHSASHPQPNEGETQNSEPSTQNRIVDPYILLPHGGSWYLVGHCHLRGEVRMFKLDRIERMGRTGESFEFPEDFDLDVYMGSTWGLLRGEAGPPEEVVLEFEADTGRWLRDQELHASQRVEELADGRVRLGLYIGITPEFRRWVLGFGRQVRVMEPAELAEWVREEARGVVERGEA